MGTMSHADFNEVSLLRFITCGSVDDGKSTLIGRILHDTGSIFEDQMESFKEESKKFNIGNNDLNFALLVDGLSAEREQGITIDVAYRYFSTERRFFMIADTPGHEQYTRNMATGASQADLAIILIDARKGVLPQTRRHSFITSMVGIRSVVIAINKMDLVNFDQIIFDRIVREYKSLLPKLDFHEIVFIPLSARLGINVVHRSDKMLWYKDLTLFEHLETVNVSNFEKKNLPFHMPVQWISRPNSDFRGFCGTVTSGSVSIGDAIRSMPSGEKTQIKKIYTPSGVRQTASVGDAILLTFENEIDTSRGDVLVAENESISESRRIYCQILWMSVDPMSVGKRYLMKLSTSLMTVTVSKLEEKIDIHSYCSEMSDNLGINEIGHVFLTCDQPLLALSYKRDRTLGAFILIDSITNETVGLGLVRDVVLNSLIEEMKPVGFYNTLFSFLKKHLGLDHETTNKKKFFIHCLESMISTIVGFFFGLSFWGAFCFFIFYFMLCPFFKRFLDKVV
ncbi:MAG: GTPases - Sulfate adenylate transferase subunit 1 [Candidatus Tokpelaia sp. JSC161]|jgi:sulfate adenylyltransferase large subunit|nr:MAG: GTPases - Sulfate adenylate transferase subunit 1 [Candidatus Tokpelaia sp. JSC161]